MFITLLTFTNRAIPRHHDKYACIPTQLPHRFSKQSDAMSKGLHKRELQLKAIINPTLLTTNDIIPTFHSNMSTTSLIQQCFLSKADLDIWANN